MSLVFSGDIDAPIEKVWDLVGNFGALMHWHPQVTRCVLDGEGIGATRTGFLKGSPEGTVLWVTERLDLLDAEAHALEYSVQASSRTDLVGVKVRLQLARFPKGTRIQWTGGKDEALPDAQRINAELNKYYPERLRHLNAALGGQPM